jgi:hypothetical protein
MEIGKEVQEIECHNPRDKTRWRRKRGGGSLHSKEGRVDGNS